MNTSLLRTFSAMLGATLLVGGCTKPRQAVPNTLDSPRDVTMVRWCETVTDATTLTVERYDEDTCEGGETAYAVVANAGNQFVHVVRVDAVELSYRDYDRSVPGNTGIIVPEGPTAVQTLAHPTMVFVASTTDPAISVVELRSGTRVPLTIDGEDAGNKLPLAEPLDIVQAFDDEGTSVVVATQPLSGRLVSWTVDAQCDDSAAAWTTGCEASATLTPGPSFTLPGVAFDLALSPTGRAYVSFRDDARVLVVGIAGQALADECGGTPCIISALPAGPSCSDGLDDDGDGLIDAADPQCFSANDSEFGQELRAAPGSLDPTDGQLSACTDGIDNDGNGFADADDPGCRDASDRVEGAGYDGASTLEALTTLGILVPSQDGVAAPLLTPDVPRCSDGIDNDGDGATDWPEDTDCYGPNANSEFPPAVPIIAALALTEEDDLLVAVDRRANQVLVYDTERLELLREINDLDAIHNSDGIPLLSSFLGPIVTDTTTFATALPNVIAGADVIQVAQRRAHIGTTSGYADTVILDQSWTAWSGVPNAEGSELLQGPLVDLIFEPIDLDSGKATLGRVDCDIPLTLEDFVTSPARCEETTLPQPRPIATVLDACDTPVAVGSGAYYENNTGHYAAFPQTSRVGVDLLDRDDCSESTGVTVPEATDALETNSVSDDFATSSGSWSFTFEGEIAGTERTDGIVVEGAGAARGWIAFAGADPCAASPTGLCSSGLVDADECPELADLCLAGSASVCQRDLDICGICPSACRGAADMCATGLLPGDIVVVERIDLDETAEDDCAAFGQVTRQEDVVGLQRLEYVVCAVTEGALEIATFADGCGSPVTAPYPAIDRLPPTECGVPLELSVVSNGWVVQRESLVGPSPYQAIDGMCVFDANGAAQLMRATPDVRFESELGIAFEVAAADEPQTFNGAPIFPRGFAINFDVERNFSYRTTRESQLLLGPATSAIAVGDTDRGRRIVFVDESQSFLWMYNASTYDEADAPLP